MKKGICYIVGAGEVGRLSITRAPGDYLVAADGGLEKLRAHGLEPDLVLGDFDSVTKLPEHPNILRFPVRKDDTDTMLALRLMLEDGWRIFCIYGGTGGRIDHTLANYQALAYLASHGAQGYLIDDAWIAVVVQNGRIDLPLRKKGLFSVFCMGSVAQGVTITGAKYEVEDVEMTYDCPLGVSNGFVGKQACVSVKKGALLVLWQNDEQGALGKITPYEAL